MTKKITLYFALFLMMLFLSACSGGKKEQVAELTGTYKDYIDTGKRIAAQTGEVYCEIARDTFKGETQEYVNVVDMLEALRMGKVDAVLLDSNYLNPLIAAGNYPDFEFLWVPKEIFYNEQGPIFYDKKLSEKYNEWLAGIIADGTMDEIRNRWLGATLPADEDIPQIELTGENGVLRVCDTGTYPPFTYYNANNEPVGLDHEMVNRFARHLGMTVEVSIMSYGGILPEVTAGKADMSSCLYAITEERQESICFGNPSIFSQGVLIVPKSAKSVRSYTDFAGKDIGVIIGSLTYNTTEKIGGIPHEYADSAAPTEDVRLGRMAGFMHALSAARVMANELGDDTFEVVAVPKEVFKVQIGGFSSDQDIIDRFNAFLAVSEADGTLADMRERWLGDELDLDASLPEIENTGENGILKVATCSESVPYVFIGADGELSGFSIELALRFGACEGKQVEFTNMDFSATIPYVASKKADIGLANMGITEERKESVLFSDPFCDEQHGILVLKESGEAAVASNAAISRTYKDFVGQKVGVKTGSVWDAITQEYLEAQPIGYSDMASGIEDIRKGRLEGFTTDLSAVRVFVAIEGNEDLECVEIPKDIFYAPMGAISTNQELIDRFNLFLAEIKADGTLDDMQNRWLETVPDLDTTMPEIPLTGANGTLKVATTTSALPFVYSGADGELMGYSIELVKRFAAHECMDIKYAEMEFGGMIPYIISGKADLAIADISITEERKKSVLFTDSVYDDQGGIIALKQGGSEQQQQVGFMEWLKTGIERNLIKDNRWKMIVDGLGVTVIISLMAQLGGTILGGFVCFVMMRKNKAVRLMATLYCRLINGTPMVVLLMITYYIIFGQSEISNVLVAIVAFTLVGGASISQILKGAIDTVDPVEIEAARSLGFSNVRAFMTVTLPQAVRRALPGYTNGFVELVKATAIVGYIAIQDLTRAGDIIRSRTYDAYFPLLFVAVIYLILTSTCVHLFKRLVKKVNGGAA